jgi:hypothetical protein
VPRTRRFARNQQQSLEAYVGTPAEAARRQAGSFARRASEHEPVEVDRAGHADVRSALVGGHRLRSSNDETVMLRWPLSTVGISHLRHHR